MLILLPTKGSGPEFPSATTTNTYAYDGAGRLTHHVVNGLPRTFAYDFQGRMTTLVDTNGAVFSYTFDAEGNRRSQSLGDCLETRFLYDGPDVLLELDPSNAVTYAWIDGPGIDQPIERIMYLNGAPRARRVFHADALGSIAALTAPDATPVQTYAYSAFGSIRSQSGPDPNRVTYTAREHLGDSQGWIYYRHRVYNPNAGRFITSDPWKFVNGANTWIYTDNQPELWIDPYGLRRKGESFLPSQLGGMGTIRNTTSIHFVCVASEGKEGEMEKTTIEEGTWGWEKPIDGRLDDLDFIFPTPEHPINGETNGAFKIGGNTATLKPDPKNPDNSVIDDFSAYWPHENACALPGYPQSQ